MSEDIPINGWAIVIDTNQYAGNFERELCVYCTGIVGDCGVGEELIPSFEEFMKTLKWKENKFQDAIAKVADDHGCFRPVSIYPNPQWFNNGVGGNYKKNEKNVDEKALKAYIKESIIYIKQNMKNIEYMVGKSDEDLMNMGISKWTKKDVDRAMENYNKEMEDVNSKTSIIHYPSYCSVSIFFDVKPNKEMIDIIKQRAAEYCSNSKVRGKIGSKYNAKIIKIEGFRLMHNKSIDEEVEI